MLFCFFFNDTATTEIYTLSLHDALPILEQYEAALQYYQQSLEIYSGYVNDEDVWQNICDIMGCIGLSCTKTMMHESKTASPSQTNQAPDMMGDRKSTRLNSSHPSRSRMPSSA